MAVPFKSTWKTSGTSFDLPFGTLLTKLKFFHVVEKHVRCLTHFRDKFSFVNSTKSLIFDLTKMLLPKRLILIYIYSLIEKVIQYQILFTELKSSC